MVRSEKNLISIIMPVLNEQQIISKAVRSLLNQNLYEYRIEILAIDGNSNDATAEIIKKLGKTDNRIKYLLNKKRKTPVAFNIGIKAAKGDYVAILGAHAIYDKNYLYTCINEIKRTNSVGCSGLVIPTYFNNNIKSKLTLWVLSSKFGVSNKSFRTQKGGFVDSIAYPIFKKRILEDIGGYNETLDRNQDNDLNFRLIQQGYKLYLTNKTSCNYFVDPNINKLYKYAYNNGIWNAKSIFINYKSMKIYHYLPGFFVLYLLTVPISLILMNTIIEKSIVFIYYIPIFLYILLSVIETINITWNDKSVYALRLPIVFFKFHLFYGSGIIKGFFKSFFNF